MKFDISKGLLGSFLKFSHLPGLYYYWWPPDFRIFTVELWFFFSFHSEFRKYQEFLTNLYFEKSKGVEEVIIWKKQVGNGGSVLLNWTGFDCSHVKTDPSYSISDLQKRFWSFSKDFLGLTTWKYCFLPSVTHIWALIGCTYPDSTPGSIKVFITFPLNGVIGASLMVSKANGVVCSNTGLWCTNASNVRF